MRLFLLPGEWRFFSAVALSLILLLCLTLSIVSAISKRKSPKGHLAVVDFFSYLLGGASVVGFVAFSLMQEVQKKEEELQTGFMVDFGDPYDPSLIFNDILISLDSKCPTMPSCVRLSNELKSWRRPKGGISFEQIETKDGLPTSIRTQVEKFNYGLENLTKPAFTRDLEGLAKLQILTALIVGFGLGIWRRWTIMVNEP